MRYYDPQFIFRRRQLVGVSLRNGQDPSENYVSRPEAFVNVDAVLFRSPDVFLPQDATERSAQDRVADALNEALAVLLRYYVDLGRHDVPLCRD